MSKPADFEDRKRGHGYQIDFLSRKGAFGYINEIADLTEDIALNHGFGQKFDKYVELLGWEEAISIMICKATVLQMTEIAETVEAARKEDIDWDNLVEEQADVIIRCINLMNLLIREGKKRELLDGGVTIGGIIRSKTEANIARPYKHGGKRF